MKTDIILSIQIFNKLDSLLKQYRKLIQTSLNKHNIDITLDQWQVLDAIICNKGIRQREIAQLTAKDTASVTRIIELLNKKGFVARQVDPDNRRNHFLGVSHPGEKEFERAGKIINECSASALSGLKENRIKKLKKVFKAISKNCS